MKPVEPFLLRSGPAVYLPPPGPLTGDSQCAALERAISIAAQEHRRELTVDLEAVSHLAGRALELLADGNARLMQAGGQLRFMNASPLVGDILVAAGLADPAALAAAAPRESQPFGVLASIASPRKLGEILQEIGLVTPAQLQEVAQLQERSSKRMGTLLVERGIISDRDRLRALSRQLCIPFVTLRAGLYESAAAGSVPREAARRLEVLPMFRLHDTLVLATSDPQAVPVLDEVRELSGCRLRLVLAERQEILKHQINAFGGDDIAPDLVSTSTPDLELVETEATDYARIDEMAGASPVINLVNGVIQRAVRDGASDIHIDAARTRSFVRFRIDGVLYEVLSTRPDLHPAIVSRLKVMANLDIAERRLPQDGRMQVITQGRSIDLRFSSLPGIFGEKVVLRVLDKNQSILDVDKLGMSAANLALLKKLLARSYGLILATGPTGSGKTTTLYAAVNHLKSIEKNIVTIEDPVEYQIEIVNQNQINERIGLSFARMLKHVLRQDPDIIMVGEIRDRETAEIAVQAALTGHLVLSTLHTNNAIGALSRMMEMGVEPYLLSSALAGIVAQRLVRGICPACRMSYLPPPELLERHGWPEGTRLSRGRGCQSCYDSGYRGRLGIHELLESGDALQRLMARNPSKQELQAFTRTQGFATLHDDGMQRVQEGRTSLEEVARVIHED